MVNNSFINTFLREIKKNVSKKGFTLAERTKNIEFMREYGLLIEDVKEAILSLTPKQYAGGPDEDRDGYDGYIYKFKSNFIEDVVIYIKIRYNPPDEVVCISFHEDEKE